VVLALLTQALCLLPPAAQAQAAAAAPAAGEYVPLSPARIVDSRTGTGLSGPVVAGTVSSFQVTGVGGVPTSGVTAVALSIAAISPSAPTWLTVWAQGTPAPTTAALNYSAGASTTNSVITKLGDSGKASVQIGVGSTALLVDVAGYYTDASTDTVGGSFVALTPQRIYDTRTGLGGRSTPLGAGATTTVQVTGQGGIPTTGVSAVVVNVGVASQTSSGWLTTWSGTGTLPGISTLTYATGIAAGAMAQVAVSPSGAISVYSSGSTHLIVDVEGYYKDSSQDVDSVFIPLDGARIYDSRVGLNNGGSTTPLASGATASVPIRGVTKNSAVIVPADSRVSAVMMSVTVASATVAGWATVYPDGVTRPGTAVLNYAPPATATITGSVIAKIGTNGRVATYLAGSAHLIIDVTGYFLKPPAVPTGLTPADGTDSNTLSPVLSGSLASTGASLLGTFDVVDAGTGDSALAGIDNAGGAVATSNGISSFTLPVGVLQGGRVYKWRMSASDGGSRSGWTAYQSFHTPAQVTDAGTMPWTPCRTAVDRPVITSTLTPTLSGSASDSGVNQIRIKYEVWPTDGSALVTSGYSSYVQPGITATWTVPSGALGGGASYKWHALASYVTGDSPIWSDWCEFTVDPSMADIQAQSAAYLKSVETHTLSPVVDPYVADLRLTAAGTTKYQADVSTEDAARAGIPADATNDHVSSNTSIIGVPTVTATTAKVKVMSSTSWINDDPGGGAPAQSSLDSDWWIDFLSVGGQWVVDGVTGADPITDADAQSGTGPDNSTMQIASEAPSDGSVSAESTSYPGYGGPMPGLNYSAMAAYAKYWSGLHKGKEMFNPAYPKARNNCASFVSQALRAGGWPLIETNVGHITDANFWDNETGPSSMPASVIYYKLTGILPGIQMARWTIR
jgi:hypothetical protein